MRFRESSIPLPLIDSADFTYRITTTEAVDDLLKSITAIGLIDPPILEPTAAGYRIVAGFRRIAASRFLARSAIQARVLPEDSLESTRVYLAIADNSLQRPLNLIESSRALNLLAAAAGDEERLIDMASALCLPDNPALIAKLRRLTSVPAVIQDALLSGSLALPMALELSKHRAETAATLLRLFTELKLGLNRQRELLTLLHEIALREDLSIDRVLADAAVKRIVDDSHLDSTRKAQRMRALFFLRRYPAVSEKSARFDALLEDLALGAGLKLMPPANFEGTAYSLLVTFDRLDQLADRSRRLHDLSQNDALKTFLED